MLVDALFQNFYCLALLVDGDVGVDIQGGFNPGVAQSFLDYFGVNPGLQKPGGVGVAEVVERMVLDLERQADLFELAGNIIRS